MNYDYSEKINDEAREWFIAMQAEDIDTERNEQFLEWFLRDPSHQKAYKDYQNILIDIAELKGSKEALELKQPSKKSALNAIQNLLTWIGNRIANPTGWAVAASFSLLAAVFFINQNTRIDSQMYTTATSEAATIHLDDGSEIILGGKTTLKTWATKKERHAELISGEAFFKIAKNPQRPFWIDIDSTAVKVVGTAFDIHKGNEDVSVAVSEGIVKVFNVDVSLRGKYSDIDKLQPATLIENQKTIHSRLHGLGNVEQIAADDIAAWRNGKLFFKYEKLKNVITDINRYYNGQITYDENIADLQLTAAVSISQINDFPEILTQLLPIKATTVDKNHIRLSAL
jgi:transmembrane sensor